MIKRIKISEQQLHEIENTNFNVIDGNDDTKPGSTSTITADGKFSGFDNEDGEPLRGDEVGRTLTRQLYPQHAAYVRMPYARCVREGINPTLQNQKNNVNASPVAKSNADNSVEISGIDKLANENDAEKNGVNDDLSTGVPKHIQTRIDQLIKLISDANLNSRKKAAIINELVEKIDIHNLPPSFIKYLMQKINTNNNTP